MEKLKYFQNIIKEKRKQTSFRDYLKELGSWYPVVFNKNKTMISRYPETDRINICSVSDFENSRDVLLKNGFDFDFNSDFFSNFSKLFKSINFPNFIIYGKNENCDYVDAPANSNNSYLSSVVVLGCENVFYSYIVRDNSKNCLNSLYVEKNSENIYFSAGIINSFKIFYSRYIKNSRDLWFCSNLTGCYNCVLCNDLENCSYYIKNKKYDKEEYFQRLNEILKDKKNFQKMYNDLDKVGKNHGSTNTTGNFSLDSENIENGYFLFNTKNARNVFFAGAESGNSNIYDAIICGGGGGDDLYGVINSGGGPNNLYNVAHTGWCNNSYYCFMIENCSYCIGCIGIKNKSYFILNKQYTKEEWEVLATKILSSMESDGSLGKFFPGIINPFYFNDTIAGLLGNFTKEEVEKQGFMWRNEEVKVDIPEGSELINLNELNNFQGIDNNGNWQISPEILKKVIKDDKGNYYRIVKMEYEFLVKYGLPIPEIHWMDRMKLNFGI